MNAENDDLQFKRADPFLGQAFETAAYSFSKAVADKNYLQPLHSEIRDGQMKLFSQWPAKFGLLFSNQQNDKQTLKLKNVRILKRIAVKVRSVSATLQDDVLKCAAAVEERTAPMQMEEDIPSIDIGTDLLGELLATMKI